MEFPRNKLQFPNKFQITNNKNFGNCILEIENSKFMSDFLKLEKNLKTDFNNKDLLKQALIHRSYINEHPSIEQDHNERLEFLGDAVLELVVTENLYNNYPNP